MTDMRYVDMYCFNYRGVTIHTPLYRLFDDTNTLDILIALAMQKYTEEPYKPPITMLISQDNNDYLVKIA